MQLAEVSEYAEINLHKCTTMTSTKNANYVMYVEDAQRGFNAVGLILSHQPPREPIESEEVTLLFSAQFIGNHPELYFGENDEFGYVPPSIDLEALAELLVMLQRLRQRTYQQR